MRANICKQVVGGGSGIRTHDTVSRIHAFQAGAFSHSAIPPRDSLLGGGAAFFKSKTWSLAGTPVARDPRGRRSSTFAVLRLRQPPNGSERRCVRARLNPEPGRAKRRAVRPGARRLKEPS